MYIYPFNTLVEQNESILRKIFGENPEAIEQIKVVNSITPIYQTEVKEENEKYVTACQKAFNEITSTLGNGICFRMLK